MLLSEALRLKSTSRLALVGAGGKSTALFRSGRELLSGIGDRTEPITRVFLATTTHLALEQTDLADTHIVLDNEVMRKYQQADWPEGLILFTGPPTEENRTAGLPPETMDWLYHEAERAHIPILVEADGSKRRPLKAPAAYEPVIPQWVETVVVTAGLSGLGKPLSSDWVHRPEQFSRLAGIELGEAVSAEALKRVLRHPEGGLKDIPSQARRVVLLNQADTLERQAIANGMVEDLLKTFHAVAIAALEPKSESTLDSDQVLPAHRGVFAVHERIAGIVLAAGGASRMGQVKQVLDWQGHALVWHVAHTALEAGLAPVIVVTGNAFEAVRQALADLPVIIAHNPDWQEGQGGSVRVGAVALPAYSGGVIFLLSDQPHVSVELVRSLVDRHAESLPQIVAPLVEGQRANPVIFDRELFPELLTLSGDLGGRALFKHYPVTWLTWNETAVLTDVDTSEDYQNLLQSSNSEEL